MDGGVCQHPFVPPSTHRGSRIRFIAPFTCSFRLMYSGELFMMVLQVLWPWPLGPPPRPQSAESRGTCSVDTEMADSLA